MNKTKRLLALVLALVMSLTLFACGRKAQDDETDDSTRTEDATRVFTDSCGREVTVPHRYPEGGRLRPSGPDGGLCHRPGQDGGCGQCLGQDRRELL